MVEHDGRLVGSVDLTREGRAGASLRWALYAGHRGHGHAARAVRVLVDWAFSDPDQGGWGLQRVEARIDPRNDRSRRVATRAGMRLEGVQRIAPGMGDRADATSYAVYARLATDPPLSDPEGFRSLLNSFLPRKRAISPDARARPRGTRAAVPADLQARLGPPRRRGRGRRVAAAGGAARGRGGARPRHRARRPAAHRLAARRGVAGTTRCAWSSTGAPTTPRCSRGVVMQEREIRDVRFCTLEEVDEPGRRLHLPEGAGRGRGRLSRIRSPVAEAGCLHDLGVRLRRGQQGPEGPARAARAPTSPR